MIVLVNRHEAREVEHEEKAKWIRYILEQMEIPLGDLWPEDPSMENLRKMKSKIKRLGIDIIDDAQDGILIFVNDDLIGEWKKPWYKLIEDPKEKDIQYRFYYEMHINAVSIFDKQTTLEENNPNA